MPLSMTPGSSIIASPELRCRHGLRRDLSSSALPILPAIRFTRGKYFGASRFTHLLRPAKLLRPLYGSERHARAHGALPPPVDEYDYNSDWTPLLAGLSPARMAASLAAPDPYMRLALNRLLPRVRTHHQIHDDTHAAIACDMLNPAQCPEHALMARIRLGLGPSLHQLRSGSLRLVRRLHSYYGLVRLPTPVHHRLRLLAFPMRIAVRESELSTDGQTWDIPGSDAIHLRVMCA